MKSDRRKVPKFISCRFSLVFLFYRQAVKAGSPGRVVLEGWLRKVCREGFVQGGVVYRGRYVTHQGQTNGVKYKGFMNFVLLGFLASLGVCLSAPGVACLTMEGSGWW